jgi:hypothetical protein
VRCRAPHRHRGRASGAKRSGRSTSARSKAGQARERHRGAGPAGRAASAAASCSRSIAPRPAEGVEPVVEEGVAGSVGRKHFGP